MFFLVKGLSEILVLLANPGNDILINLILSFQNFFALHYFLLWDKYCEQNKMGCFISNDLVD